MDIINNDQEYNMHITIYTTDGKFETNPNTNTFNQRSIVSQFPFYYGGSSSSVVGPI